MKVKSLYIKKYKALKDFKIDFNDNVNVILGGNGMGKTTILEMVYALISGNSKLDKESEIEEVTMDVEFTDDELMSIKNLGIFNANKLDKIILKNNNINKSFDVIGNNYITNGFRENNLINKVVYLPTSVNFKKFKVESVKKIEDIAQVTRVLDSEDMSINLKEYLINIHYKDLEDMSIGDKPYRIQRFKKLYNSFFEEKEFVGIKDFEPLFKIKATGEIHSVDELSSGEKQIFFRGGSLLQLNLNNSILLIDEPELSLHPEWQQKILDFYKNIGENNQIIIATHSPHIVSECKKDEVIVLENKNGNTTINSNIEETYGWTVEQLLLSVFELKSIRNPEVQSKLDRFNSLYINRLNLNENELVELNSLKDELEKYLDPEDPSLSLINISEDTLKLKKLLENFKKNKNA